ncbi:putative stage IV sporulation YqfD [Alkaliphilus metalliredigens QYMF]|uniref:Putative stage IV sporulation YqfD n=1 Tax=Alkaliphilus metalliredigens (strain QYMF) TaxID=293826 RepID=A6TSK6_ALKMQ|nr:sporulation protein YqfD [Alkaliphilus metalliredigens]ABR49174.1 putative stage IV sporulation YqfD [Alkaliphilus metalliredigens QYMF]
MLILNLWNYFRGYVIIKVEGLSLEKFINLCIVREIYLWDIKRTNYTTVEMKVGIKAFKELRKIVRRTGCRVSIIEKSGYPFVAHQLKKRKMLLLGAFFSLLLLIFTASFIFTIELIGNDKIQEEEILEALNESGLKIGSNRYLIDRNEIEEELMIRFSDLAWVGIEIRGIQARVEIVEKTTPPVRVERDTPSHVVARKNAVIERIVAKNGDAVVKQGDIVSEGDLLITGVIEREQMENPMIVHAYGEVYGKTYYETTKAMELIKINKEKTGETFTRRMFKIGDLQLSLDHGEIPYEVYIIEKTTKKLLKWRNQSFPVEMIVDTYYEAIEVDEMVELETAKKKLHEAAIAELLEEIPLEAEVLNTMVDFKTSENTLYGKITIEALEEISAQSIIEIEARLNNEERLDTEED